MNNSENKKIILSESKELPDHAVVRVRDFYNNPEYFAEESRDIQLGEKK